MRGIIGRALATSRRTWRTIITKKPAVKPTAVMVAVITGGTAPTDLRTPAGPVKIAVRATNMMAVAEAHTRELPARSGLVPTAQATEVLQTLTTSEVVVAISSAKGVSTPLTGSSSRP